MPNPFGSRNGQVRVASETGTPMTVVLSRLRDLGAPTSMLAEMRAVWAELDDAERGYLLHLDDALLREGIARYREDGTRR